MPATGPGRPPLPTPDEGSDEGWVWWCSCGSKSRTDGTDYTSALDSARRHVQDRTEKVDEPHEVYIGQVEEVGT